jgi:hypothetical protein
MTLKTKLIKPNLIKKKKKKEKPSFNFFFFLGVDISTPISYIAAQEDKMVGSCGDW